MPTMSRTAAATMPSSMAIDAIGDEGREGGMVPFFAGPGRQVPLAKSSESASDRRIRLI